MKFLITDLDHIPSIAHGFFTRDADRKAVAQALEVAVVGLKQIHSAKVVTFTDPWDKDHPPEGDAIVTTQKNVGIFVITADCAPVLFADRSGKVVGAAHAGWKGALNGVLEATIAEMEKLGAKAADIEAAIGPCIGFQSYEVSEGFEKPFLEQDAANSVFFQKAERAGHLMFNLPGYVAHRLKNAGLAAVYDTQQDTLANEGSFCSYRRATLRGEKNDGRQLSAISIKTAPF